jgi:hypothetical protein
MSYLSGYVGEEDFLIGFYGSLELVWVYSLSMCELCNVREDTRMTKPKPRSLADRIQELLETLREALSPRRPARIPVPVRDEPPYR